MNTASSIVRLSRLLAYLSALPIALISLGATSAPAITGVDGAIAHGGTVSISGSAFGTRSSYNNINATWQSGKFLNFRFKDFEDNKLNSAGFYPQRGGGNWSPSANELSTRSGGPANSSYYMRRAYSTVESGGISANASGAGNQLYTTFKFMIESNTQSGKFWRFYADSPQNNVYLSAGCDSTYVRGYSECSGGSCAPKTEWGSGPQFKPGQWHRVEILADAPTNTFTVWMDGQVTWTKRDWLASKLGLNGHTIDYPNMIDGPERGCGTNGSYNFDDVFIDFTLARVEISDSPTWSGARRKEVQIPVQWSNNSIDIRINTGTFSTGQAAYLYVVDASGKINEQGYPITIGKVSAHSNSSPNPPTSVSVQ